MAKSKQLVTKSVGGRVLVRIGSVGATREVLNHIDGVAELVSNYREALKSGKDATKLFDEVVIEGARFRGGELLYKVAQGLVLSAIKATTDPNTYEKVCQDHFKVQPDTADRYVTIWDALFSGEFLYKIPENPATGEPYNIFELSIRDMELLAEVVIEGALDETVAAQIWGEGNWMDKREVVRDEKPELVKRKTRRKKKKRFTIGKDGDLVYTLAGGKGKVRFGFLDIASSDTALRTVAKRAAFALQKEFGEAEEDV